MTREQAMQHLKTLATVPGWRDQALHTAKRLNDSQAGNWPGVLAELREYIKSLEERERNGG